MGASPAAARSGSAEYFDRRRRAGPDACSGGRRVIANVPTILFIAAAPPAPSTPWRWEPSHNFRLAVKKVERIWSNLHVERCTRPATAICAVRYLRLVASRCSTRVSACAKPLSLLNNRPAGGC